MSKRVSRQFVATVLIPVALCFAMLGCASDSKAGLSGAVDDFNSQRYTQAKDKAQRAGQNASAGQREDAAYVAGLSAYQLGQTDEAERQFIIGCSSSNPQTAARSKAMLGQVRMDQRRPRDAAPLLVEAAQHLEGDDSRKAAYNAAIAYQQCGDSGNAKKWLAVSHGSSAEDAYTEHQTQIAAPPVKSGGSVPSYGIATAGNRGGVGTSGFTLQVGAFSEKKRAQQAADEASKLARRDGLGDVLITPRLDQRGRMMYFVQFGSFSSRDAAAAARARLGRLDYIVAVATSRS